MQAMDFPGRDRLVALIDDAVSRDCAHRTTECLRDGLSALIRSQQVQLPACVFEPVGDHYARRELYRCDRAGYSVVAMTWGPGQGTPVHDHSGLWCVEGVWTGQLEITQYEPREQDGDRYRFEVVDTILAGAGSAGSLIPPHEYHAIRNPSDSQIAVSLHVYKAAMTQCSVFEPGADGWYTRAARQLALDEAA
jgi:predicted metal-dependent enzyme (double-stranded beta helix superfamily)